MSIEKSIGWTDRTINPVKGMCKVGCWYCWTKPLYKMKRLTPEIRLDCSQFLKLPKIPKKIFLCSTHDLFGLWISEEWRDIIFDYIRYFDQHTFQILTKFPKNIDRPMPKNVWLGVSITGPDDLWRIKPLSDAKAKLKFISFEPLLDFKYARFIKHAWFDWVIVGRLSGYGKRLDPHKLWITQLVYECQDYREIPIFMKNNLKEIWGEDLIQEFPK